MDWDVYPFTRKQAEAIRACLERIADVAEPSSKGKVTDAFRRILGSARHYELQIQPPGKVREWESSTRIIRDESPRKVRVERVINQLAKKHGANSLPVRWVREAGFPGRGRPRGSPLDAYLASIAGVYRDLSGKYPKLSWSEHGDSAGLRGQLADLLHACLEFSRERRRIPNETIRSALRRILKADGGQQT